jgi:hypothetical protein
MPAYRPKKTRSDDREVPVPKAMSVQLARLFGSESPEARGQAKSRAQWRHLLKRLLAELDAYLEENVDTDDLHRLMLSSGLFAAHEALSDEEFWPGYIEGLVRFALLLMGDYPDHRRRRGGRKKEEHYRLRRFRSVQYSQTPGQRLYTLFAAGNVEFPGLSKNPRDAMAEFRDMFGYSKTYREFLRWYRRQYPQDYTLLF